VSSAHTCACASEMRNCRFAAGRVAAQPPLCLSTEAEANLILCLLQTDGEADGQYVESVQTALVSRVELGSPAHSAGLRSGQRILAVDGVPVSDRSYIDIVKLIADRSVALLFLCDASCKTDTTTLDGCERALERCLVGARARIILSVSKPRQNTHPRVLFAFAVRPWRLSYSLPIRSV
jgi:hypothetical protein